MKAIVLFLSLFLVPTLASADWYLRYDPPATKTAKKAADISARAVAFHFTNIDDLDAGGPGTHFYTRTQSEGMIAALSSMCYQYPDPAARIRVTTKPGAPAVCVWDRLKSADKARVRAMGLAPE